jgi:DNA replication protein DnaC
MKQLNTIISSKFETVGTRICESCGAEVQIIRVKTPNQEREVSRCLSCDSKQLQAKCQQDYEEAENSRNDAIFQKYSIIPDDISNARFTNYKPNEPSQHEAKRMAMSYAKNFDQIKKGQTDFHSLLLQGSYGLGKSHLAYAITAEVVKSGYSAIFIDMPQLLQLFRDNIQSKEVQEQSLMKYISSVDLCCFDDMGAEYIKHEHGRESWAVDKIFQIFSARSNKPKIITTNYDSKGLQDKYGLHGGRIVSRMMMGTKLAKMDGKDFRIKNF